MAVSAVLDAAGRRRSPATMPGYHAGRPLRNKGRLYPADPPTVEEIVAVMREASDDRHGYRLRALVVVLWRGGLRVAEALALGERDLDPRRGSLLVRNGKGGRSREVGMDAWGWEQLRPWLAARLELPVEPLFCVIDGPTRGRPWSSANARVEFRRLAAQAGIRAPLCAPPAAPRPRRRARPRGRAAERDPAPARPRQPRHDLDLPAGHRRDHRHRPREACADDVRHRRTPTLNDSDDRVSGSADTAPAARWSRRPLVSQCDRHGTSPTGRAHPHLVRGGRASRRT
jgi:integrase